MFVSVPPLVGFRRLQAIRDLAAVAAASSGDVRRRVADASGKSPVGVSVSDDTAETLADRIEVLDALIAAGGRATSERSLSVWPSLLVAAALPGDDREAFALATAILIADRLQGGAGTDDLDWHLRTFVPHWATLAPGPRAAIAQGAALLGHPAPEGVRGQTRTRKEVIAQLATAKGGAAPGVALRGPVATALAESRAGPDLGRAWMRNGVALMAEGDPASRAVIAGLRHLYETGAGFDPWPGERFAADDRRLPVLPYDPPG